MKLVGSLQSYKMEPLIVFSFSRRECEAYSLACANPDMGNLCFANADEAAAIEEVRFAWFQQSLNPFETRSFCLVLSSSDERARLWFWCSRVGHVCAVAPASSGTGNCALWRGRVQQPSGRQGSLWCCVSATL
jgi:hypothetical protein